MGAAWSRELGDVLQLGDSGAADIRRVVDAWVGTLPETFWQDAPDSLERSGHMRAERVRQAAHAQYALVQRVLTQFGSRMTPAARARLVENLQVLVPLPR